MKLQNFAIIFIIIILPISYLLTQYIQGQIQSITYQTAYSTRLDAATYDAVKAFQINTVNNSFSSINDSKIRDINASVKSFYNSIATSMNKTGISGMAIDEYVPAVVYTLYDGYYIYTRYNNSYTDAQNNIDTNTTGTGDYEMGLKPLIRYAARYKNGTDSFVVNYTLDNCITVIGQVDGEYVTKTGFLINPNDVSFTESSTTAVTGIPASISYKGVQVVPEQLAEDLVVLDSNASPEQGGSHRYPYFYYNGNKIYLDDLDSSANKGKYFYYTAYQKQYVRDKDVLAYIANTIQNNCVDCSAMKYYYEAYQFSKWVNDKLGTVKASNVTDPEGNPIQLDYEGSENIFALSSSNDPMLDTAVFNEHRSTVIRHSIKTNLITAIAAFSKFSSVNYEFRMPVLSEEDWYKVENNISVISFMQGLPLGGYKIYSGYSVITNNKNKEYVSKDSIYIGTSGSNEYHKVGCKSLNADSNTSSTNLEAYALTSYLRKTISASKNVKYYCYPQSRVQCYNCIVNTAEKFSGDELITGAAGVNSKVREAYIHALARERYAVFVPIEGKNQLDKLKYEDEGLIFSQEEYRNYLVGSNGRVFNLRLKNLYDGFYAPSDNPTMTKKPITVELCFSFNDTGEKQHLFGDWEGGGFGLYIEPTTGGAYKAYGEFGTISGAGSKYEQVTSGSFKLYPDNIYTLSLRYVPTENKIELYVNGNLKTSETMTGRVKEPNNDTCIAFGCNPTQDRATGESQMSGRIYRGRIYNKALSGAQIKNNYYVDIQEYGI